MSQDVEGEDSQLSLHDICSLISCVESSLVKSSIMKENRLLPFEPVDSQLQFMKGKILTVIDAVIPDEKQKKATKDLIHGIVGTTRNMFWRHCIGQDVWPTPKNDQSNNK